MVKKKVKRKKALVTGGAGFIGSNIVKALLEKNYKVVVYDDLSTGYKENLLSFSKVKLIKGDIRDEACLTRAGKNCNTIFHLAASVGNIKSLENPKEDSEVNVIGTLNVLKCAQKNNIKKIVYSSSAALFGEPKRLPIDEKSPLEPDSPYGVSKMAGEKHILCFGKLYGIDVVALRYFNVYGINQRYDAYGNVVPIFATFLLKSKPITIYGDGEQTRDFVNVNDIARANLLAAEKKGLSGTFNIGTGKSITVNYLVKLFRYFFPSLKVHYAPSRKGEVKHSRADITLARKKLGYKPSLINKKKIKEYIDWIKSTKRVRK